VARAIPVPALDKITTVGAAFGAGLVEAAAYRLNPVLGTVATFGGGMAGLVLAMTMPPRMAQVAEGVASSSAGSLGHFAVKSVWPGRRGPQGGNGRREISGSPREVTGRRGNPGNPGTGVHEELVKGELRI